MKRAKLILLNILIWGGLYLLVTYKSSDAIVTKTIEYKSEEKKEEKKERYEAPDEIPETLNAYSESELKALFREIVAYQDLATETAYNVWGKKNDFMKEANLYNELDSISKIDFLNKHDLTEEFHLKLSVYGAKKRWVYD